MADDALVRLERVLALEESQGMRNRAVIGGLQSMAPRWVASAREEGIDAAIIRRVEPLMVAYARSDVDRKQIIAALRETMKARFDEPDRLLSSLPGAARPKAEAAQSPVPGQSQPAPSLPAQSQPTPSNWVPAIPPSPERAPTPEAPMASKPTRVTPTSVTPPGSGQENVTRVASTSPANAPSSAPAPHAQSARPPAPKAGASSAGDARQKSGKGGYAQRSDDAPALGSTWVFEYEEAPKETRPQRVVNRQSRRAEEFQESPKILQGVGPSINEHLERLGILKVEDLLWHLPFRYDDFSTMRTIAELEAKEQATILANLWAVSEKAMGFNRSRVEGVFSDGTSTITSVWWNKWVKKDLTVGETYRLSGKVGLYRGLKTLENPTFESADTESLATGRIAPVYRLTEGISQKKVRQLTNQVLEEFSDFIVDPLPEAIRSAYHLDELKVALNQTHFPDDEESLQRALRRLAFDEFLYIQLGVLQHRNEIKGTTAQPLVADGELLAQFTESLPFDLTGAQTRVLDEVAADLTRSVPMTRLVQGDVGSGKTAIAAGALYVALQNGAQGVMLAPTQILAEQHARALTKLLSGVTGPDGHAVEVALLTGRVTGAERERILEGLRNGDIAVIAGTTAVIQETVEFANLGLVIVDEQHRFGVEQRGVLRTRGNLQPHMLVMSATPIPRSLALTLYGDLDISVLDEMPAGRLPIKTVLFKPHERERIYSFLIKEAAEGRQAFIVYPLVEDSEVLLDLGSATEAYERLQREVFPNLRLALLHGQMKGSEKDAIMRAFAEREYDILVSTTVIEVGIDVPNATVVVIEDAERFGLAQLHQIRGRVGRGDQRSFCVLVSKAEGEAAVQRLNILATTNDGFVLAEKDLELRGPGDFFGTRQTGLPELQIALFSDVTTMHQARDAAEDLLRDDPELTEHPLVAARVEKLWRGQGDIS